ncbi:hypothetical protein EXIGLDRAFT_782355 [Exidia glandulosa HHB12029]|uniref:Uncharacterized protein n=1 Tax=Exidia glandulosa HHB12029 TaxID=1314781 RepID=A0A165AUF9_EXIGL|nr:hypothetical protein EXIGLDRAFT_782355 [Exidia glandulosa HHB12029]
MRTAAQAMEHLAEAAAGTAPDCSLPTNEHKHFRSFVCRRGLTSHRWVRVFPSAVTPPRIYTISLALHMGVVLSSFTARGRARSLARRATPINVPPLVFNKAMYISWRIAKVQTRVPLEDVDHLVVWDPDARSSILRMKSSYSAPAFAPYDCHLPLETVMFVSDRDESPALPRSKGYDSWSHMLSSGE